MTAPPESPLAVAPHVDDLLGRRYFRRLVVDAEAARRYAAVAGDRPERYGQRATHPCFVVNPAMIVLEDLLGDLALSRHRMLHGLSDMRFLAPLPPGAHVDFDAGVAAVGRYGSRTGLEVVTIVTNDLRPVVVIDTVLAFAELELDGLDDRPPIAVRPASTVRRPAVAERSVVLDADLPRRYAVASRDHNPIHLDPAAARAAGLPGVVLHGMSVMAVGCTVAIEELCGGDPTRLRRMRVRFSQPVAPGSAATYRFFETAVPGVLAAGCSVAGASVWKQSIVQVR